MQIAITNWFNSTITISCYLLSSFPLSILLGGSHALGGQCSYSLQPVKVSHLCRARCAWIPSQTHTRTHTKTRVYTHLVWGVKVCSGALLYHFTFTEVVDFSFWPRGIFFFKFFPQNVDNCVCRPGTKVTFAGRKLIPGKRKSDSLSETLT